ncbi:MAG: DUF3494 domain-containing protein, partial [Pedobacter sp.]
MSRKTVSRLFSESTSNYCPRQFYQLLTALALFLTVPYSLFAQNPTPPNLGGAANFGLLSGVSITSNTPIYVYGKVGAVNSVNSQITSSENPVIQYNSSPVPEALLMLDSAILYCNALPATSISQTLAGQNLSEGVYSISGNALLSSGSPLVLNGDSLSVFIFNITDSLDISADAMITLNGVLAKNIYWNVGKNFVLNNNAIFFGVLLVNQKSTVNGYMFGTTSILSSSEIILSHIDESIGHNYFFSISNLTPFTNPQGSCNTMPACLLNMVRNGEFEELILPSPGGCPSGRSNMGTILANPVISCHWRDGNAGTAEYYNSCSSIPISTGVFHNGILGNYHFPTLTSFNGGNGFAGFIATREYIQQDLQTNLTQDKWYYGEFYTIRSDQAIKGVDNIG